MGYDLHITRASDWFDSESAPISIDEWKLAVASVTGTRLDDGPVILANPKTGERIAVSGRDGDVAVLLDGTWVKVFHYYEGRIVFKAGPVNLNDSNDKVAVAAFRLAQLLSAKIVGDEGEIYEKKPKAAGRSKGKNVQQRAKKIKRRDDE